MKTAECVTPKHPDKMCDRISDAILDECLRQDKNSRVAVEVMGGHGIVTITGELTTEAFVDCRAVAQKIVEDKYGVQVNIVQQSPEIARGVDGGGAGDQGIMIGYATGETKQLIPLEVFLSRDLARFIYQKFSYDGKTQITIDDKQNIVAVVVSFQNTKRAELKKMVDIWLKDKRVRRGVNIHLNPAGDWSVGGFEADTGVTGRKLAVDNYGPNIPIGGGCFSGKDATKVDRSGAYLARKVAVEILRADATIDNVLIQVSYAIGKKYPLEIVADIAFKDGQRERLDKTEEYRERFVPSNIIRELKLKEPQFEKTAEWGHFGNGFSWE